MWGALILGERYGKEKHRRAMAEGDNVRQRSINFNAQEMEKVMKHVNRDYH